MAASAPAPLVHVDDVFAWFRTSGLPYGGFVNSDIVLQPADPAGFLASSVRANIDGAMLFSRRIEVQRLDVLEGPSIRPASTSGSGTAACSRPSSSAPTISSASPLDYYAVLMPLVHGFKIRQFAYPLAFHETHAMFYDVVNDGIPYALKTFELVAPHFERIPPASPADAPARVLPEAPAADDGERRRRGLLPCLPACARSLVPGRQSTATARRSASPTHDRRSPTPACRS